MTTAPKRLSHEYSKEIGTGSSIDLRQHSTHHPRRGPSEAACSRQTRPHFLYQKIHPKLSKIEPVTRFDTPKPEHSLSGATGPTFDSCQRVEASNSQESLPLQHLFFARFSFFVRKFDDASHFQVSRGGFSVTRSPWRRIRRIKVVLLIPIFRAVRFTPPPFSSKRSRKYLRSNFAIAAV